jgi:hypothetical protein
MLFLNNSPNHFMILYAISREMKSEKKGFFGVKKGRNND